MSQILINVGGAPNDGTGDSIRAAFTDVNANFTDLYNKIGGNVSNATTIPSLVITSQLYSNGNTEVQSSGFHIIDSTLTRKAYFSVSTIPSGSNVLLTLPSANTTIVGANIAQTLTNKTMSGVSNTFTNIPLTSAVAGILPLANGGTNGLLPHNYGGTGVNATPTNGQLLIGDGSGYSLATLTAGAGIAITNLSGQIVIENTGGGGGGGSGTAISDGTTSIVVSNTSLTTTTTIAGSQTYVANANVAIYSTSLQLAPGTTARAPLVFPAGSLLSTPQNGAIEYDSTKFYITLGGSRKQIATYDQITAGSVTSWNGMTGNIIMSSANVTTALGYTPLSANTGGNVGGSIIVTGNITTVSGGGTAGVGNVTTGNVTATNYVTSTYLTGTLLTNAQPNITTVGTLGTLAVTGNISATSIAGTLTTASQTNITSVGYLNWLNMAGNISMGSRYITGLANGTISTDAVNKGYVDAAVAAVPRDYIISGTTSVDAGYSDINLVILGSQVASVTPGNLSVTGNVYTSKNVVATANVTAGNILTSTTTITTGVITSGNVTGGNIVGNTGVYGTIRTAAQPNITSLGTLTGLTVSGNVTPGANATINLGSTSGWFNNVYAVTFTGVSTTAKYADLAEKYLTDKNYPVGTVVAVGGDAEATACQPGNRAFGVVSEFPAYLMNSDSDGQAVALKGRVPVLVTGPVVKGQRLIAGPDGTAIAVVSHVDVFAIALESNSESGVHSIEAIIL